MKSEKDKMSLRGDSNEKSRIDKASPIKLSPFFEFNFIS